VVKSAENCPWRADAPRDVPGLPLERIVMTGRRILIVEHDILIRDLVMEWLSEAGYAVSRSDIARVDEDVDLIIADPSLPQRGRSVLVKALHTAYPSAPILLISGWFRAGLHGPCEAARDLGVGGVLSIPFSREELLTAVGDALETIA
jgi:DNA-binding NtrC family response regulator